MTKPQSIIITLLISLLALHAQAQVIVLQPLNTFGTNGDGSIRPGDYPFVTGSSQLQRGLAYNSTTGHLLVVDRSTNSSANNDVYVLDGNTGALIDNGNGGKLDNSSILVGGNASFLMNMIGVADDGAIYVANLTSSTLTNYPQFRLYRWANESSAQTLVYPPPIPGFFADPSNGDTNTFQKRWGDTMTVRGSGIGTQVLIANRGTLAALFTPDDSSLSLFSPKTLITDVARGGLGYGLTFGAGDTFWGTAGASANGPLLHLQFNAGAGTATTIGTLASPDFPGTISPILVIPQSNLLAGITMVPGADVIRLYDISNSNAPVLLDRKNFVTANNNNTFSGSLTWGTNGVFYALDSDNGIMAFTLTGATENPLPPTFFLNPADALVVVGNTGTLTSGADSSLPINYQWFFGTNIVADGTNATLTFTNVQTNSAGSYSVVASNSLGSVTSSVAVLTVATKPPNSLLVYEPFNYPAGSAISNQPPWFATTANTGTIEDGSLTNANLPAPVGNKFTWGTTNLSARYPLGVTNNVDTFYFSFLYRVDNLGTSSSIGQWGGLVEGNTSTLFGPKLLIRTNGAGGYNLGVTKGGGTANAVWATNNFAVGETVLVVSRYVFNQNTTTDDTVDLWVNPDPSTFEATNAPPPSAAWTVSTVTDLANIDHFFFRGGSGNPIKHVADELRVGFKWADVTPVPVVAPPTMTIVHSNASVVISWPLNAAGFTLEGTASFSPTNWVSIPYTNNSATINASSGNQFIRLRK